MLTIIQKLSEKDKADNAGEDIYLNHAYLGTCCFGSKDMAWTTSSPNEARAMLKRAQEIHRGERLRFEVVELY